MSIPLSWSLLQSFVNDDINRKEYIIISGILMHLISIQSDKIRVSKNTSYYLAIHNVI